MADIDPELMDERVAALDDKLAGLLADIETTCVTWALGLVGFAEQPTDPEEA
ncbi:hypothetical protein [Streptomyces sp. NPDC093970]|uniref:hypothetical protein n=1 Tax=Streptomyces sp. NPDC093970 TaxID=3155076 RepID=UPI00341D9904